MKYTLTTSDIKYIHTIAKEYIHKKFISKNKTPITGIKEYQNGDIVAHFNNGFIQKIEYGKVNITDEREREMYEAAGVLEEMEHEFYNCEYWEEGHPVKIICNDLVEEIFWENNNLTKIITESVFFDAIGGYQKTDLSLRTEEDYIREFNCTKKDFEEYGYVFLRTKDYLIHALEKLNVPKHKTNENPSLLLKNQ